MAMKVFRSDESRRAPAPGRVRISHGTIVAYAALFFALCGSGYAATQIGGPRAHAAKARGLKVHCTARQKGKKVKCQAVVGVVVGPRGPRGFQGPPGKSSGGPGGGGGNTVLTDAPAYTGVTLSQTSCDAGSVALTASGPASFEQTQSWSGSSNCAKGNGYSTGSTLFRATGIAASESQVFSTYLLSPSQVDGSASHLDSIQFCYGAGSATAGTGAEAQSASFKFTQAEVYEIDEPAAATAGGGAPPYKHELLMNAPLSLSGSSNCQTVAPPSPPAIDSSGYLLFQLFVTFSATAGSWEPANSYPQAQANTATAALTLGRLTTTYSP
jgi:hypothetical protein